MKRREFLMLAHKFDPKKYGVGGWFWSRKIDGIRCFSDGGITRGMLKKDVPWANCAKDHRFVTPPVSTGLWTRLGNVIHAPGWWLDKLPKIMLDGELHHGVYGDGQRQVLTKIVKPLVPGMGWKHVKLNVFDMPPPTVIFGDGHVKGTNFTKIFKGIKVNTDSLDYVPLATRRFEKIVKVMEQLLGDVAIYLPQTRLPMQTSRALEILDEELLLECSKGGEGLMLRKPESYWQPQRVRSVLKVKKIDDAEGIVTGYTTGRETDKGSKLLGLMGALILNYEGKRLELSGFTEAERVLERNDGGYENATRWAEEHPGEEVPSWISAVHFPRGSTVTFHYRGVSLDGIPTEARYWRKRDA
jgi:hypothetical protein